MRKIGKEQVKKGGIAIVATAVAVGVGFGVKALTTTVKKTRQKRHDNYRLKELENEQFED